jgi:hypothetical protein
MEGAELAKRWTMTATERATQIWPVLAWASTNRQILTYEVLSRLIGVPAAGLGQLLEPIQSYCLLNRMPPLTILVVSKNTGMPGSGFVAATDIPQHQGEVFGYDWLAKGCPTPDEFDAAVKKLPSCGIPSAPHRVP